MMSTEKQKTILLVEDEAIIAMAEKTTLEKYGYRALVAHSGEEAVAAVKKTPGIDLILMDINGFFWITGPMSRTCMTSPGRPLSGKVTGISSRPISPTCSTQRSVAPWKKAPCRPSFTSCLFPTVAFATLKRA